MRQFNFFDTYLVLFVFSVLDTLILSYCFDISSGFLFIIFIIIFILYVTLLNMHSLYELLSKMKTKIQLNQRRYKNGNAE